MSYATREQALANAARLMKEAGADSVKLEGGIDAVPAVEALVRAGGPVLGHIGLTPQTASALGGYKLQGRDEAGARRLLEEAMGTRAAEVQQGTVAKVGVNTCQIPEEQDTMLRDVVETKIEPCLDHIERIREFKKTRNRERVCTALARVRSTAENRTASLMEPVLSALEADATLGELSGVMRMAYGMPYDPLSATAAAF